MTNFDERIYVRITGDKSDGDWAKSLRSVPETAETGHVYEGSWLTPGARVDLAIGDLYLNSVYLRSGRRNLRVQLLLVMPDGPALLQESTKAAWAQELRKKTRDWLELSPKERIAKCCQHMLTNSLNKRAEAKEDAEFEELDARIAQLRGWIAELEPALEQPALSAYTVTVTTYGGNAFHNEVKAKHSSAALVQLLDDANKLPEAWASIEVRESSFFADPDHPSALLVLTRPLEAQVRNLITSL